MKKRGLNLPKERVVVGPANAFKRVIAFLVDLFIIYFIIGFPLNAQLGKLLPEPESMTEFLKTMFYLEFPPITFVIIISLQLISILYFVVLEYKFRQSLGKMMLRIYVAPDKKELKFWQLIVRSLFLFADIILIIDVIYYLFNKDKKRLLEVLSKTKTIENYVV